MTPLKATAAGWRLWLVDLGADHRGPPVLQSPYATDGKLGKRHTSATIRAECYIDPAHQPPAAGCTCGVYASESLLDALVRLRALNEVDRLALPILSRVNLFQVREGRDPLMRLEIADLRGNSAVITEFFLGPNCAHRAHRMPCEEQDSGGYCPLSVDISRRLADTFGVPATPRLPRYNASDWEAPAVAEYSSVIRGFVAPRGGGTVPGEALWPWWVPSAGPTAKVISRSLASQRAVPSVAGWAQQPKLFWSASS